MHQHFETIRGDLPGSEWRLKVLRFRGSRPDGAPPTYLQAALHGDEVPGVATLHVLAARLRSLAARGDLFADVTIVPVANPIGLSQSLAGEPTGRYDLSNRMNFNRDFPVLARPDPAGLLDDDAPVTASMRLKARLVRLMLPAEIVLDLHCDEQALPYVYLHAALWPACRDLAAAMPSDVALLWDGDGGGAFEEAAIGPFLTSGADLAGRVVSTVELRGRADVSPAFAEADADGLLRFLAGRGVVAGEGPGVFEGPAEPLDHVEMIRAPRGGIVLYHREIGDRVAAGDRLATLLFDPAAEDGAVDIHAPQGGLVLSRRDQRLLRPGEDVMKVVASGPSATAKPGPLES
jgi:predicted deacylase